ncbi:hypothetical protein BDZ89DRAFT_1143124 [Hymenopellis radicata]|nr:hypothetical protein BDZ89DRAFT_1143124 [Hymenopellis radicata]
MSHLLPTPTIAASSTAGNSNPGEWNPPPSFLPSNEGNARRRAGRNRADLNRRFTPLGIAQPGISSSSLSTSLQPTSSGSSRTTLINPPILTYSTTSSARRNRALSHVQSRSTAPITLSLTPAQVTFLVVLSPVPSSHYCCRKGLRAPCQGPQQVEFRLRAQRLRLDFTWTPGPHSRPDQLIATPLNNALVAAMEKSGMVFVAPETSQISSAARQARPLLWDALVCKQIARAGSDKPAKLAKCPDTEVLTLKDAILSAERYSNALTEEEQREKEEKKENTELLLILVPRYDIVVGPYAPGDALPVGTHMCLYERLWKGLNSDLYAQETDEEDQD